MSVTLTKLLTMSTYTDIPTTDLYVIRVFNDWTTCHMKHHVYFVSLMHAKLIIKEREGVTQ